MVYDDIYVNFAALVAAKKYNTDYHILTGVRSPKILYTAIHGGGIETGTTELAMVSAGTKDSYYCFEGFMPSGNADLHITSTHFDEPNGVKMVRASDYTIAYHGYLDTGYKNTKIGGLDIELKNVVLAKLRAAGFNCEIESSNSVIPGLEPNNITNTNKRSGGLQLEISTLQLNSFFGTNTRADRRKTTNAEFHAYVQAIQDAVKEVAGN